MELPPLYLIGSFLAFTEAKSMSLAAQDIEISQPALTLHLKLFNEYFPQDVFGLEGRRKVLTPFGQQLKEILAGRFANLENDVKTLVDYFQKPENAVVRIAGRGEILNYMASKIDFTGQLQFCEADGASAVEGVIGRKYEVAVSSHVTKAQMLYAKKLFADEFSLLIPKKWFGEKKTPTEELVRDLATKPYLAYNHEDQALKKLLNYFNYQSPIRKHRIISHWPSIIAMVELGQGWALAPTRYKSGAQTLCLSVPARVLGGTQFYILYRKESITLPWFKTLLDEIKSAAES